MVPDQKSGQFRSPMIGPIFFFPCLSTSVTLQLRTAEADLPGVDAEEDMACTRSGVDLRLTYVESGLTNVLFCYSRLREFMPLSALNLKVLQI